MTRQPPQARSLFKGALRFYSHYAGILRRYEVVVHKRLEGSLLAFPGAEQVRANVRASMGQEHPGNLGEGCDGPIIARPVNYRRYP